MVVYLKLNKPLLNYYCKEWQHVYKKTQVDSQKTTKGNKPESDLFLLTHKNQRFWRFVDNHDDLSSYSSIFKCVINLFSVC